MKICRFCNKDMKKIDHHNPDLFDVYLCVDCLFPDYMTRYRELYRRGQDDLLAVTIRIDEFYVILNHQFNYTTRRTNYSEVYKNVIGEMVQSVDLQPLTWTSDLPVCDVDTVLKLPFHDPAALKRKLQIYVLFS
jgi:hypothetical protein